MAIKLYNKKMDIDSIIEITELSKEQVLEIINNNK